MGQKNANSTHQQATLQSERECPHCAENIKRKAKVCRFCNRSVTPIYVDNLGANKQIAKILALIEEGENYESVAEKLNESKDFRIDSGAPWEADSIEKIHNDFGIGNIGNLNTEPKKKIENVTPNEDPWMKEQKRSSNPKFFVGTLLVLLVLGVIFGQDESESSKRNTNYITAPFTEAQVCKAGIATMNIVSPKIIKLDRIDGDIRHFSYVRRSDNTTWKSRCKIEGNKIIWGFNGGRWRVDPLDTVITFKTTTNVVTVYTTESDGSTSYKVYGLSEVRG